MNTGLISAHFSAFCLNTGYRVRSVGQFFLHGHEKGTAKTANFPEIFWCIAGKGAFMLDGKEYFLLPDQVFYYPQGSRHIIQCAGTEFNYRWLAMEGPYAAKIFDGLLKPGLNIASPCPAELFNSVARKIWMPSPVSQLDALADAMKILLKAAEGPSPKTICNIEKVKEIIELNFSDPELNVEKIAEMVNMHRVSLSRAFARSQKMTVTDYLQSRRFKEALFLLQNTDASIAQIAGRCGYANANYFAKFIRKRTGGSPSHLRTAFFKP